MNNPYKLSRCFSDLYKNTTYITQLSIIQNHIYEYDIKSANISVLRESGKLSEALLDKIAAMDKDTRNQTIGNMIREDKEIWTIIKRGIQDAKYKLFKYNEIKESEVVSIKNDAVFITGRKLKHKTFNNITFRIKGEYNLFVNLNGIEFYYSKRYDDIDVKGIDDKTVNSTDHQNGIIRFLKTVFKYIVYERYDTLRKYLIDFSIKYKKLELPHDYYREFNEYDFYRTNYKVPGFEYNLLSAGDSDKDIINGIYNYTRFVLPIIQKYI